MTGIWLIVFVLQWLLLLLLAVLMVGVLRYLSFVQRNIHLVAQYSSRFDLGERISHFELPDLEGLPVVSKVLFNRNQRTVLLFLSTSCSGCSALVSYLANLVRKEGGLKRFGWSIVAIYTGPYTSRESAEKHIDPVLLNEVTVVVDEKASIFREYDIRSFPVGIAVDQAGHVVDQSSSSITKWLKQTLQSSVLARQEPSLATGES